MKKIFTYHKAATYPVLGAAVGAIQLVVTDKYADVAWGPLPVIGPYLPAPWNKWSTGGNMIIGGIAVVASIFTKALDEHDYIRKFVQTYGAVTLIGGFVSGIVQMAMVPPARARVPVGAPIRAPGLARMPGITVSPPTPTGIPPTQVLA